MVLETRNHGRDEWVAGNGSQDVALVAHMLDLLEPHNYTFTVSHAKTCTREAQALPSTFRRILRAKTLSSSPGRGFARRASHTRAKVPMKRTMLSLQSF